MNFFDDDEYLDFNPFECDEDCPFMRQQFGPGGHGQHGQHGGPGGPGGPGGFPGGPGGFPGGPGGPGGPPPFGPGFGPGGPGGGPQGGPPMGPPPKYAPQQAQAKHFGAGPGGVGVYAVDPGAIRPCRYRYTYLWLRNGQQFWSWPTFIGRTSLAGWRWNGRRWVYFGTDLRRIVSFYCY